MREEVLVEGHREVEEEVDDFGLLRNSRFSQDFVDAWHGWSSYRGGGPLVTEFVEANPGCLTNRRVGSGQIAEALRHPGGWTVRVQQPAPVNPIESFKHGGPAFW
jgi:hypothetical protein